MMTEPLVRVDNGPMLHPKVDARGNVASSERLCLDRPEPAIFRSR